MMKCGQGVVCVEGALPGRRLKCLSKVTFNAKITSGHQIFVGLTNLKISLTTAELLQVEDFLGGGFDLEL